MKMQLWIAMFLGLAAFVTALGVVLVRHESREQFMQLRGLERERDALRQEWSQLQLEEGTWSGQNHIQTLARKRLDMSVPATESIVLITP